MTTHNSMNGIITSVQAQGFTRIADCKLKDLDKDCFREQFLGFIGGMRVAIQNTGIITGGVLKDLKGICCNDLKWNGGNKFVSTKKSGVDNNIHNNRKINVISVDNIYSLPSNKSENDFASNPQAFAKKLFSNEKVSSFLSTLSRIDPFSVQFSEIVLSFSSKDSSHALDLLAHLKKLKYFLNLPIGHVLLLLSQLATQTVLYDPALVVKKDINLWVFAFARFVTQLYKLNNNSMEFIMTQFKSWILKDVDTNLSVYRTLRQNLEKTDPHATYPTSIYRRCHGNCLASSGGQTIEAVMGTVLTTTIKITRSVLDPHSNNLLADIYLPLGRVVAVVDDKVDKLGYSDQIREYFGHFNIKLVLLVFGGNEIDKDMSTVEKILVALKKNSVSRNQPVLVVGGGVLADTAGLACALYHRNTPYVMLSTSIVSGIDAGPSPRTCCDGFGFKNLYGSYHPPVLTLTDRMFWKTLRTGWVRHGIAEIVKMACVKDLRAFELLEKAGSLLVKTKFGTEMSFESSQKNLELELEFKKRGFAGEDDFQDVCDEIVGRAMEGYVRSEYCNLWETHQARPHAYGHTWSPGYELPAGMLHGHAVATGMGFGAFMARYHKECQDGHSSWLNDTQMMRILNLINELELALYHPIMDKVDVIWASTLKMIHKRGGNLAAPVPKGEIGQCGYINILDEESLRDSLKAYKDLVTGMDDENNPRFARNGHGVDVHCHDVGLQNPSDAIKPGDLELHKHCNSHSISEKNCNGHSNGSLNKKMEPHRQPTSYQDWIKEMQTKRHKNSTNSLMKHYEKQETEKHDELLPPSFPHFHLFADESAELYATKQTTPCSENIRIAAQVTDRESMFLPCMVGAMESQFLKMISNIGNYKRILDIGTFTGMSAIAFAESGAQEVVTLEFDKKVAKVAQSIFDSIQSEVGKRITMKVGDAREIMRKMSIKGEKFDLIFLDADKENYEVYYELAMDGGLLAKGGIILADNSACALLYDEKDKRRNALHRFNRRVAKDERVEQVLLTLREGVTIIRRKEDLIPMIKRIKPTNGVDSHTERISSKALSNGHSNGLARK